MLFLSTRKSQTPLALIGSGMLALGLSTSAQAVDWGAVPATEVGLFFPGQTSLEWIYSKRDHDGAARYKKRKKSCQGCHDGDQKPYGDKIVAGGDTEPEPLGGRRGFVQMQVQLAQEGGNLLARLSWPKAGGAAASKQDADNDTKVTLLLDDNSVEEFVAGGCWAVCHSDSKKMPAASGDGKTKYLAESRTQMDKKDGGGDNLHGAGELDKLLGQGIFLEYWQAQLNPGQPAKAVNGYILSERSENAGSSLTATATENGDSWVVEFSRPLAASGTQKALAAGKAYTIAFALHDQNTIGRYHLASLQYGLSLDGGAATLSVTPDAEAE
ncbi:MAG TPA: ethylbenzene dehydrogenase-related protein [Motiliproteus sp.]